jgi:hypothetical protein
MDDKNPALAAGAKDVDRFRVAMSEDMDLQRMANELGAVSRRYALRLASHDLGDAQVASIVVGGTIYSTVTALAYYRGQDREPE